jgi:large-conductance mechanosensitive channel
MNTSGACAVINKLTFIILENNVIDLKVSITVLTTTFGNILRNLLDSNIDLKLHQHKNIEGKIDNFYFIDPSLANNFTNSKAA